jgi:hypothetical protein
MGTARGRTASLVKERGEVVSVPRNSLIDSLPFHPLMDKFPSVFIEHLRQDRVLFLNPESMIRLDPDGLLAPGVTSTAPPEPRVSALESALP